MSSVIRWEEPPPARGGIVRDWTAIAAELKSHPGSWAVVAVCTNQTLAAQTAQQVRHSHYVALQGDQYEAKARTVDGEFRVYARYIGETPP